MDVFEITEWKSVSRLAVLSMRRVDFKMPLFVFSEAAVANERVLLLRTRMMIPPLVFLIQNDMPLSD